MLGAIIGDIVGSRWEFNPTNDSHFVLFSDNNDFTDDTICTIAVADALLRRKPFGETIHAWCRRYPHPMGGYGGRFHQWVMSDNPSRMAPLTMARPCVSAPSLGFIEDKTSKISTTSRICWMQPLFYQIRTSVGEKHAVMFRKGTIWYESNASFPYNGVAGPYYLNIFH